MQGDTHKVIVLSPTDPFLQGHTSAIYAKDTSTCPVEL